MTRKDFVDMIGQELPEKFNTKVYDAVDTLQTSKGTVHFYGPLEREDLENLTIDDGMNNFRSAKAQYEALLDIANLPHALIFTACHEDTIIGYIAFHKPEFPRWCKAAEGELPELIELGGIEVSDNWWGHGVAKKMLEWTFSNYDFENKIVISMETCYNWRSRDPSVSVWEYREMLKNVLGHVGLVPKATDDPEILEHPANMLTARIGSEVSEDAKDKFEKLLKLSKYQKNYH
ncbi:GNAT family N-acetyltransferase [Natranaerofaba carboxydovora]|uniref:GNAT family N-acetyltransferase n=1 Tax=Natranaerofaba carboxydovora TaxID=2742683 RepID=UPI001F14228B|nr:GNAT family N-acetyltransferase [Natranaerofaba carboxydovora]UMZ74927.1 Acetoin utilization protein AcuA [Natranaerofaba carboxydovora]